MYAAYGISLPSHIPVITHTLGIYRYVVVDCRPTKYLSTYPYIHKYMYDNYSRRENLLYIHSKTFYFPLCYLLIVLRATRVTGCFILQQFFDTNRFKVISWKWKHEETTNRWVHTSSKTSSKLLFFFTSSIIYHENRYYRFEIFNDPSFDQVVKNISRRRHFEIAYRYEWESNLACQWAKTLRFISESLAAYCLQTTVSNDYLRLNKFFKLPGLTASSETQITWIFYTARLTIVTPFPISNSH